MIVFAVCDDNRFFADLMTKQLRRLLVNFPDSIDYCVHTFSSAKQVLNYTDTSPIHILFLDVDMPQMNGFELAEILRKKSPSTLVVFVSAHDELVYEAFRYRPFGFLRKSHLENELFSMLQRVIDEHLQNNETVLLPTVDGEINVRIQDIVYVESVKNYFDVHCCEHKFYRCRGSLALAETILQKDCFCRIHTAFLINLAYIQTIQNDHAIQLTDGSSLSVSLRRWKEFNEAYAAYSKKRVITP